MQKERQQTSKLHSPRLIKTSIPIAAQFQQPHQNQFVGCKTLATHVFLIQRCNVFFQFHSSVLNFCVAKMMFPLLVHSHVSFLVSWQITKAKSKSKSICQDCPRPHQQTHRIRILRRIFRKAEKRTKSSTKRPTVVH